MNLYLEHLQMEQTPLQRPREEKIPLCIDRLVVVWGYKPWFKEQAVYQCCGFTFGRVG